MNITPTTAAHLIGAFILLALPWAIKLSLDTWAGQQQKEQ